MAALSTKRRNALPRSAFAYPKTRSYPIDTKARARNALARAAQSGTKGSYAHVAAAVRRRWGGAIGTVSKSRGTLSGPGYRRHGGTRRRRRR
jgi:hypothetical protein